MKDVVVSGQRMQGRRRRVGQKGSGNGGEQDLSFTSLYFISQTILISSLMK
jgi:hypothetical protein